MAADTLDRDYGVSWAIDRVAASEAVVAPGTVKDCHILGHALQLQHPAGGRLDILTRECWSARTDPDFAAPTATVFHQDIGDATAAGLRYATSLEAAVADLGAAGEIP